MTDNAVAIQFEKYDLNEDMCIFKPVSVMRGEYDRDYETFISESGFECACIDGGSYYDKYYYGYPTTIKELKKRYQITKDDNYPADTLLTNYFNECQESYYLGFVMPDVEYDYSIRTVEIPLSDVEDALIKTAQDQTEESDYIACDGEDTKISFNLESLEKLRDSESLEAVQAQLNSIIMLAKRIQENRIFLENGKESKEEQTKTQPKKSLKKEESKTFNLAKFRKEVLANIVAQDDVVNKLTTTIGVNLTSKNPKHKSHILIAGPSGTGKTAMVDVISKYLGIPYFKADATAYTKEGYVGKSVYSMLTGLIDAAGGDIEKAQNGILIIDEIDKKAGTDKGDVSGETVLTSMLKILDRDKIELDTGYYSTQEFDTSNLTVILMGAFSDLYENKLRENNKVSLGFGELYPNKDKEITITREDLIKYGMPAEFLGRIDDILFTKEFSLDNIVKIMKTSKLSPLKTEKEWFDDRGVETVFTNGYYIEIAKKCLKSKTGARNIKSNVKYSLSDAYDAVLLNMNAKKKIKKLTFTKDTVNNPKKYHAE